MVSKPQHSRVQFVTRMKVNALHHLVRGCSCPEAPFPSLTEVPMASSGCKCYPMSLPLDRAMCVGNLVVMMGWGFLEGISNVGGGEGKGSTLVS